MNDINTITISGRLTKDVEVKVLANYNDNSALNFTVATGSSRKVGDEWMEDTIFMDCRYFSKSVTLPEQLTKGVQVVVTGKLNLDKWKDKEGVERQRYNIQANQVLVINPKKVDKPQQKTADEAPF